MQISLLYMEACWNIPQNMRENGIMGFKNASSPIEFGGLRMYIRIHGLSDWPFGLGLKTREKGKRSSDFQTSARVIIIAIRRRIAANE